MSGIPGAEAVVVVIVLLRAQDRGRLKIRCPGADRKGGV
ncbi:hypothetical protein BOS5A_210374 [Bosea sp. EC-HK365B]|nr:hypothetical protein BOSE7B_120237 [Bosea sp. 7B]CAD5279065.1 hypothetical protein BOSE21B_30680 [Bosea sp. 21B]VVT59582.1 hypothetical protein BOS5A_210374 [Bosea sp. EC-HK365B]VXB96838.1 hypothetical protein BOSE127_160267 [Bosea sp. 127]